MINVVVVLKANVIFAKYVKVTINGMEADFNEPEPGKYIASIVDERITNFDFDFNLGDLTFDHESDKYDVTVSEDSNKNIEIKVVAKDGFEFSKRIGVIVNDVTYSAENIIFSDKEIIVKIADKVVNKVNITLNCLNLAPSDYNVSTGDYKYTVQLIPDKPNYEYVYVVVTLNEGYEFGDDVKVYVNNKEVAKKMFVINGNTLKYTQDDPNWTDIF